MDLKKISLSVSVALLSALFIGFFIDAVYPSPSYEDFCSPNHYPVVGVPINSNCTSQINNTLVEECYYNGGRVDYEYDSLGCVKKVRCDYCDKDYRTAYKNYVNNIFVITAPIALVLIILGLYLPKRFESVSSGFLFGGVLTLIQITFRVFGEVGKWTKVIILAVELVLVVWIGVKKVDIQHNPNNIRQRKQ